MASKNKYAPDVSWEDVSSFVREHTKQTGYQAHIVLCPLYGPNGDTYAEVHLRPLGATVHEPATLYTRGPLPLRQVSRQMSCILHLVAQAYEELACNPWLWTPAERARARGEVAGE